jgi:L-ascorbate metabolism protein UlaG (beta-lactamase superfamily)
VLLELDGARVLTDPVLRDRVGPLTRTGAPVQRDVSQRIDAVLLSHLHADHADPPSLRRVDRATPVLAPRGAGRWLKAVGRTEVHELSAGDELSVGGLRVRATPAVHEPRRWPLGPRADPIGFVVRGSRSVYFAGDTDLFAGMADLARSLDVALLPVWGWGPSVGEGHLDPRRAAQAAALIAPRVAVPIHWGTFALMLARRPWKERRRPAREFAALVAKGAPDVEVRLLDPGERTELAT